MQHQANYSVNCENSKYCAFKVSCLKGVTIIICLFFTSIFSQAQHNIADSSIALQIVGFSYALQFPGGDLADRFGNNSKVSAGFAHKTADNLLFGLQGGFLFGNDIKEEGIEAILVNSDGFATDRVGALTEILLYERGLHFQAYAGKTIPLIGPNPNSGLTLLFGVGYLQHKIRLEHNGELLPLLEGEYLKGYDRLTAGISLTQSVGYMHFSNNRLVNFHVQFSVSEGFTKSLRGYNYDTMSEDNQLRLDLLYGFQLSWLIPIYKRAPNDYYYN